MIKYTLTLEQATHLAKWHVKTAHKMGLKPAGFYEHILEELSLASNLLEKCTKYADSVEDEICRLDNADDDIAKTIPSEKVSVEVPLEVAMTTEALLRSIIKSLQNNQHIDFDPFGDEIHLLKTIEGLFKQAVTCAKRRLE